MARHSIITEDQVLKTVKLLRYVSRRQLAVNFTGKDERIKILETALPKLEREGQLVVTWHDGEKVYSPARKNRVMGMSIDHEIGVTEGLIRILRCRMAESEIIPEKDFRGFAIVPEWGIRYTDDMGTMLLYEYCTEQNFKHGGVMKSKLTRYKKYLPDIEAKTNREITVLFVIDTDRVRVKDFVRRIKAFLDEPIISGFTSEARYPFFFTDYQTFKSVPIGEALTAKIYFWHDGEEWSLTNHA
jgi:hypothetical protein